MPGLHRTPPKEVENEQEQPGVQPEETIFNKEDVIYFPSGRHIWRQQGPYCVCKECELGHAVFIGIDKEMYGEDENGKPMLRDRVSI